MPSNGPDDVLNDAVRCVNGLRQSIKYHNSETLAETYAGPALQRVFREEYLARNTGGRAPGVLTPEEAGLFMDGGQGPSGPDMGDGAGAAPALLQPQSAGVLRKATPPVPRFSQSGLGTASASADVATSAAAAVTPAAAAVVEPAGWQVADADLPLLLGAQQAEPSFSLSSPAALSPLTSPEQSFSRADAPTAPPASVSTNGGSGAAAERVVAAAAARPPSVAPRSESPGPNAGSFIVDVPMPPRPPTGSPRHGSPAVNRHAHALGAGAGADAQLTPVPPPPMLLRSNTANMRRAVIGGGGSLAAEGGGSAPASPLRARSARPDNFGERQPWQAIFRTEARVSSSGAQAAGQQGGSPASGAGGGAGAGGSPRPGAVPASLHLDTSAVSAAAAAAAGGAAAPSPRRGSLLRRSASSGGLRPGTCPSPRVSGSGGILAGHSANLGGGLSGGSGGGGGFNGDAVLLGGGDSPTLAEYAWPRAAQGKEPHEPGGSDPLGRALRLLDEGKALKCMSHGQIEVEAAKRRAGAGASTGGQPASRGSGAAGALVGEFGGPGSPVGGGSRPAARGASPALARRASMNGGGSARASDSGDGQTLLPSPRRSSARALRPSLSGIADRALDAAVGASAAPALESPRPRTRFSTAGTVGMQERGSGDVA